MKGCPLCLYISIPLRNRGDGLENRSNSKYLSWNVAMVIYLTRFGLVIPYDNVDLGQISIYIDNGFLPDWLWCYQAITWTDIDLTHWGRVTHICVSKLTIIGSDNGLSPGRRQAIIWTNAVILLIGPLEILVGIQTLSVRKMHLKMSSAL